ncbi:MAG: S1 RNA-binding domain-containing protein [Ruminococcaceae bacterium]|nr:S1 RNA-binding domain-containing protein [Oscillospiraceae bacterium]
MQIEVGQIVEGKITGITNFGVFVDLGDSKSGMVHISEVARSYVTDIREHVKENDVVKMKVLNIDENGKISLSIKKAQEEQHKERVFSKAKGEKQPAKIEPNYTWTPKKQEPVSFEEMMNKFKQTSDEKFSDLKRKNPENRRSKRGGVK